MLGSPETEDDVRIIGGVGRDFEDWTIRRYGLSCCCSRISGDLVESDIGILRHLRVSSAVLVRNRLTNVSACQGRCQFMQLDPKTTSPVDRPWHQAPTTEFPVSHSEPVVFFPSYLLLMVMSFRRAVDVL